MRLTNHILTQVSYWTHVIKEDWGMGFTDVFTLHFKQWWKPRKTIRILLTLRDMDGDVATYRRTIGSRELEQQLQTLT